MTRYTTAPTLILVTLIAATSPALAQQTRADSVHWAYSAYFGTGWYSVTGDRDVFVLRMTPRWTLSEPGLDADGKRTSGIFIKAPVSVGLDQFDLDNVIDAAELDNVAFLSVNPGIDIEIPVTEKWSLRPYASLGYGQVLNESESAWTYWAGIKSRVTLYSGDVDWHLISQVGFVGYTPSDGPSDSFWPVMAGLAMDQKIGAVRGDGSQWLLNWNATYTFFADDLLFNESQTMDTTISDQWELGLAVGKRDHPIRIWFLNFDRLGLGYRASSDGNLKGITFIFRSVFDE